MGCCFFGSVVPIALQEFGQNLLLPSYVQQAHLIVRALLPNNMARNVKKFTSLALH